jgi:hypothetical protein
MTGTTRVVRRLLLLTPALSPSAARLGDDLRARAIALSRRGHRARSCDFVTAVAEHRCSDGVCSASHGGSRAALRVGGGALDETSALGEAPNARRKQPPRSSSTVAG